MNRWLLLLVISIMGANGAWSQDSILPIDEAFYEAHIRNSSWTADRHDVDGAIIAFRFSGDSLSFMILDVARGSAGADCTFRHWIQSNALWVRLGGCSDRVAQGPICCYFTDPNTMMVPVVTGPIPRDISKIAPENWLALHRYED